MIGSGMVQVQIVKGILIESYYVSAFSYNILSVSLLLKDFEATFTGLRRPYQGLQRCHRLVS